MKGVLLLARCELFVLKAQSSAVGNGNSNFCFICLDRIFSQS